MRDHPVIECMERTGYPDGRYPDTYECPSCGAELAPEEDMFGDECEYCVSRRTVAEYFER